MYRCIGALVITGFIFAAGFVMWCISSILFVWFFDVEALLFDAFWGPGPPRALCTPSFEFFFINLRSKLVLLGSLVCHWEIFWVTQGAAGRVFWVSGAHLARSRCQRPPPPLPSLLFEWFWIKNRSQNGTKRERGSLKSQSKTRSKHQCGGFSSSF